MRDQTVLHNRWKRRDRNNIYSNNWIRLDQDLVLTQKKVEKTYAVLSTKGGVGVVPVTNDGYVYLVAQYRYAPDVFSLEIPKGAYNTFNSLETPLEAAKRELMEETGIIAKSWIDLAIVNTLMGYSDDKVHLFLAQDIYIGKSIPDECEEIDIVKFKITEVFSLMNDGISVGGQIFKMYDATSIAGIALAMREITK